MLEAVQLISSKHGKIRAFAFAPPAARLPAGVACRLALALATNQIEVRGSGSPRPTQCLALPLWPPAPADWGRSMSMLHGLKSMRPH